MVERKWAERERERGSFKVRAKCVKLFKGVELLGDLWGFYTTSISWGL